MEPLSLAETLSRHDPAREAVVHGQERLTFGQLHKRARHLAGWLVERGVARDDLVAFALPNGPDFIALTFAIYMAGATPAPLSPRTARAERDAILETMRPALFAEAADIAAALATDQPSLPGAPVIAASWKACTSGGSTGRPKVIVDGRPAAFAPDTGFIAIPRDGRVLVPGPLYHNAPFSAAVFGLWSGSTVVTMDRFDAGAALGLIEREAIEWALMVPTMMHRIMALPPAERDAFDLSRWQTVVHTAAPMARWLKHAWIDWRGPDHIWEVYGATEGLVRCWIGGREWLARPGSVGRALGDARIRILRADGSEAATGETGEIFAMPATGPGSTYRYIGANRRTGPDGWESVGDMGHVDEQGYLFLADRKDDLIISGGINIWPAEVEAAILRHPAVRSCAVFGVPHEDLGAAVHAVVETDENLSLSGLTGFLSAHLTRAKHPRSIECTSAPVRDDAGKFRKPRTLARSFHDAS
ncbi:MAG: AMP-binding protein [Novosphingobium sp.]